MDSLLFLLLMMVCEVSFFKPTQLDKKDHDPTPKLAIFFDETGIHEGRALRSSMTFGLVVINPSNPQDANKKLTFDKYGFSNSTVLQVDNVTRRFGSNADGAWKMMAGEPGGKWKGKKSHFILNERIHVTQLVELVPGDWIAVGPNQFKRFLDTCRVRYLIENHDKKDHKVGLRMMIDTLIGKDVLNDGVPFLVPGKKELVAKMFDANEKNGDMIPNFLQVLEDPDLKKTGIAGFFNLKLGGQVQAPSRVSLTHWPMKNIFAWDVPLAPIADDSCVVLYWKEEILKPGQKREVGFSYGLAEGPAKNSPLVVSGGGTGKEFTVTALVRDLKEGDTVTLKLPDGLNFKNGSKAEQAITKKQASQNQVLLTWSVEVSRSGAFEIQVSTSTGLKWQKRFAIKTEKIF